MVWKTSSQNELPPNAAIAVAARTCPQQQQQWWLIALGWAGLVWYTVVTLVCWLGYVQIQRKFSRVPRKAVSSTTLPPSQVPHVTVIRPIKGTEPYLYECLAASLRQDYPKDKLTVSFCVSTAQDPALPVIKRLLIDFPDVDARLYIEPEYSEHELGPNPKVRNMSKAYHEAKGDIIWIMDCNVWLGKGVCGRMVDRLCGFDPKQNGGRKYKFVHHLPIVVDVDGDHAMGDEERKRLSLLSDHDVENLRGQANPLGSAASSALTMGGGRLEELFLASAHAKMYSAINTVLVAPCIIGKSSMFRRSHLDYLTSPASGDRFPRNSRRPGIDFFSDNICEDHLVGDRLWKGKILEEAEYGEVWAKHDLAFGDLAIQPMSGMSVRSYIDRRIRWLRVRKFTVLLATLVEPGTESFLCSLYLAFGVTTILPQYFPQYCPYLESWRALVTIWMLSISLWIAMDWTLYWRLHSADTVEIDEHTPPFARPHRDGQRARRPFREWFLAWLGREALALPIWLWAIYGGTQVVWRDRAFRVGLDTVVHQLDNQPALASVERTSESRFYPLASNEGNDSQSKPLRRRTPNGSLAKPDATNLEVDIDSSGNFRN